MTVLFTVEALDGSDNPVTLRFSDGKYSDAAGNPFDAVIADAPLVSVIANDGGLLALFSEQSIGDVSLNNVDGDLNYLVDYAVDGRDAVVSFWDGTTVVERFRGTVGAKSNKGGQVIFPLKAGQETLTDKHPAGVYGGTNTPPAGLDGTEDTIKGNNIPKVFGDVRNISAVLVNSQLQIYQVSSLANCRITAVYDGGIRLSLYRTSGAHAIGVVGIAIDTNSGLGDIPTGAQILFSNHKTIYTVQTGLAAGVIVLTSGLTAAVAANTPIDTVNFYTDTDALQSTDYFVAGDHLKGVKAIAVDGGVGAINGGDRVVFGSHLAVYTVQTGLAAGGIVIEDGLDEAIDDGDIVHVVGSQSPVLWGSFQGYFRLTARPAGAITCDAMSIDEAGNVHQAGDVFGLVAAEKELTVNTDDIVKFNAAGVLGLYLNADTTTQALFNKIALSVGGYYHVIGTVAYLNLLSVPAASEDFVIDDYQIDTIDLTANGLGGNGLPIYGVHYQYDRIETVQDAIEGNVGSGWRQRLKSQYRESTPVDNTVLARHPLSRLLDVESLLRTVVSASALAARLMALAKVRRDVITLVVAREEAPLLMIGSTGLIVTPRLGYSAGRKMVLAGYQIDDMAGQVTLFLYG